MKEYLYTLRSSRPAMVADGPTPEESAVLERHHEHLKRLASEGTLILAGRTENRDASSFGIVIFRAEGPERARRLTADDPAVAAGLKKAELFPYRVAVEGERNP